MVRELDQVRFKRSLYRVDPKQRDKGHTLYVTKGTTGHVKELFQNGTGQGERIWYAKVQTGDKIYTCRLSSIEKC
jgi:hypothetical protein